MKKYSIRRFQKWSIVYLIVLLALTALDIYFAICLMQGEGTPFQGYMTLGGTVIIGLMNGCLLLILVRTLRRPQTSGIYKFLAEYYNRQAEAVNVALESGQTTDTESMELAQVIKNYASRISELDLMKKQAENDALQSQINPHFLYNTLDTIRGQALEDGSGETAEMIECLSHIFRYSIDQKRSHVTFEDELQNVTDYLKIQQYRFENRFTVKYEVDKEDIALMDARIPKLTLQPLVENAIKHGLEGFAQGGLITIRAYTTKRFLYIQVEDNGVGMTLEQVKRLNARLEEDRGEELTEKTAGGIALYNVNRRIRIHYGADYGLTVSSGEQGGVLVEVCLPNGGAEHED